MPAKDKKECVGSGGEPGCLETPPTISSQQEVTYLRIKIGIFEPIHWVVFLRSYYCDFD